MPKGQVDYQKGLIYTIKTGDSLYVGSTTNFIDRKYKHKNEIVSEKKKGRLLYKSIINNGGEWEMKPYKIFPCNSKLELEIEEEKIRRELKCDLNMIKCNITIEEEKNRREKYDAIYYKKNREKKLEQTRAYNEKNKDLISKKRSVKKDCECGCSVSIKNWSRHLKSQIHQDFILSNNT